MASRRSRGQPLVARRLITVSSLTISSYTRIENVRHQGVIVTERELYCSLTKNQYLLRKSKFTNMLAVISNRHLIKFILVTKSFALSYQEKRRKQEECKTAHSSPPDYETRNIVASSDGVPALKRMITMLTTQNTMRSMLWQNLI